MENKIEHKVDYYLNNSGKIRVESYYLNGKYHREDGAAQIFYYEDGTIEYLFYYNNGLLHNDKGAAEIYYTDDDPAMIDEEGYWFNGKEYTDKNIIDNWVEFCKLELYL